MCDSDKSCTMYEEECMCWVNNDWSGMVRYPISVHQSIRRRRFVKDY